MAHLIIGGGIYLLTLIPQVDYFLEKLSTHSEAAGNILASYSFTVAGFLSVVATFLYTMGDKPYFIIYAKRGNFGDLMLLHLLALIVLAAIFGLSLMMLVMPQLLHLTMALTSFSVLQLAVLTFVSYSLTARSQDDSVRPSRS